MATNLSHDRALGQRTGLSDILFRARKGWVLYCLLVPVVAYYVIFRYQPILVQFVLAFKDYRIMKGPWASPWVGLKNFKDLFTGPDFWHVFVNTLEISLLRLLFGFLPPVILAILLFDLKSVAYRRFTQTVIYLPNFFSWVVVVSLMFTLFSSTTGLVNSVIVKLGMPRVNFWGSPGFFRPLLIGSGVWKGVGWGTIIYMAALSLVDHELYDAAKVDGAGPLQRLWYITLPSIRPTMVFVLTLNLGYILYAGGEQVLLMYNSATMDIGDILDTWIYRHGILNLEYNLSTTMGLFQSMVGLCTIVLADRFARRFAGVGIW
jgi:putative aldouronate transport system permease protein